MGHIAHEIGFADIAAKAWIEASLFGHARHGKPAVVVCRIQQTSGRQRQDLASHRPVHRTRIALLEVGSSAAADQQAIAGKRRAFVVENKRHATLRMTRRCANLEIAVAELDAIAVLEIAVRAFRATFR